MLSLQKRLRFIVCQLHLSKVCFCLKKRETESYWFGMFGSFLNPNKPTYLLWKQKWEYLVSSGSDGGPSTCSLPWRATSSPPSSQELSPCLVSGLLTSHGSSHPEPKEGVYIKMVLLWGHLHVFLHQRRQSCPCGIMPDFLFTVSGPQRKCKRRHSGRL